MAKSTKETLPAESVNAYSAHLGGWVPPTADEEFTFTDLASAPAWVDKGWASWSNGPALALPAGDIYAEGPYTTKTARVGDKVMFIAGKAGVLPHFEVVENVGLDAEAAAAYVTLKPAQQTNASLEDMLKTGMMAPEDLGTDAKGQVAQRSPRLQAMIEGDAPAPKPVAAPVTAIAQPTT